MGSAISLHLQFKVKDGRLEDFRTLMEEMVSATQTEPGTLVYEWFLGEDKSTCYVYERYTDSAATVTHLGSFGAKFAERFMGMVEGLSLNAYGEASDEVREILTPLGASFGGTFGGFSKV